MARAWPGTLLAPATSVEAAAVGGRQWLQVKRVGVDMSNVSKILMRTVLFMLILAAASAAFAQAPLPPPQPPPPSASGAPPSFPPQELDRIVSPVALYPDPLLAQALAATTYSADIPDAARWADEHHYLTGQALTAAMTADQLPWDPSVQALLPFPSVLGMMASSMPWTQELGNAFLAEPAQVMDAVQRMRQKAASYGYLRSNAQVVVHTGPYVEIAPVNPAYVVVPYYDPAVVFVAPRHGVVVTGAIRFGYGVTLGAWFAPWGWGTTSFGWANHVVIVNHAPWGRTWYNRATYVHPYVVHRYAPAHPVDRHAAVARSPREREEERAGRKAREEHHQN
jgi:hypothetical protein